MASLGKCAVCNKTVYALEGVTAVKKAFHNSCFKCETCGWKLTLTSYKSLDDHIYCKAHFPVTGFGENHVSGTRDTKSLDIGGALNAPKVDNVNNQVRGTGEGHTTTLDRIDLKTATDAPKLDNVNHQVRGAGSAPLTSNMDRMDIAHASAAPKLDTINHQIRGATDVSHSVPLDRPDIKTAMTAPKLDTMGGIHRGGDNRPSS